MTSPTMRDVIQALVILAYFGIVGFYWWNLGRRVKALEARRPTTESVTNITNSSLKAVEDSTAMIAGLRNALREQGFPADIADELVVEIMRGAAQPGRQEVTGLADKVMRLGQWKADALEVLEAWERVWETCGRPGPLGASKADNVGIYINHLASQLEDARNALTMTLEEHAEVHGEVCAENAELKQWVSDACELLHDINYWWTGHTAMPRSVWQDDHGDKVTDLLRRMENP